MSYNLYITNIGTITSSISDFFYSINCTTIRYYYAHTTVQKNWDRYNKNLRYYIHILNWFVKAAGSTSRTTLAWYSSRHSNGLLFRRTSRTTESQSIRRHLFQYSDRNISAYFSNRKPIDTRTEIFRRTSPTETLYKKGSHKYERFAPSLRTSLSIQKTKNSHTTEAYKTSCLFDFGALLQQKQESQVPINTKDSRPPCGHHYRFRKPIERISLSIYWRTHPTKTHTRVLYKERYF